MAVGDEIDKRTNPGRGEAGDLLRAPGLVGEAVTTKELERLELPRYVHCVHGVITEGRPGAFCGSRHIRIMPANVGEYCADCTAYDLKGELK